MRQRLIAVAAGSVTPDLNLVVLVGTVTREPTVRRLPSGSVVVEWSVSTVLGDQSTSSVPVSWVDPPSRRPRLSPGDRVMVCGTVRRRFFRAGGATASRTEVVPSDVVALGSTTARARVVHRALDQLAALT